VRLQYRSFLLEPGKPAGARPTIRERALTEWGMSGPEWDGRRNRIRAAGLADGLDIRIDTARAIDSRPAHRLLKLAAATGVDEQRAWHRVYAAHLRDNVDLEDPAVLRELGGELGLAGGDVDDLLRSDRFATEVTADHDEARARGIHGVPAVVRGGLVLAGSRGVDELRALIDGDLHR
jgi:predicted DsbA family dithiol-disulfide isomerase